jgi:hypothetical protein
MNLTSADIAVGKLYRGKRPRKNFWTGDYDDRVVLYIDRLRTTVQYDSVAIRDGRHYPKVTMERFLKWAKHEVSPEPQK